MLGISLVETGYHLSTNTGITDDGLAMAVVIQEMCESDVSGVLFTAAPFNEMPLSLNLIGDWVSPVVSGAITPDSFHVSRDTSEIFGKNHRHEA